MSDNWHSAVEQAHTVNDAAEIDWDHESDVVVIGMGGAGVACALQSLDLGLSVTALDRFEGGGATKASGGVIYAGGGTRPQEEAGIDDDPQNMFNYLKLEIGEIVSDKSLMDFCKESAATVDWMAENGVDFRSSYYPKKTSYPAPEYFIYHSDNSLLPASQEHARATGRGHRGYVPIEQGRKATNLGGSFYDPMLESAVKKGLNFLSYSEARQMILDSKGRVLGVKFLQFADKETHEKYLKLRAKSKRLMSLVLPIMPGAKYFMRKGIEVLKQAKALEDARDARYVRAKKGVCLSAGGFIFNRAMVDHYAPKYSRGYPLGTDGDDGSGIRLGQSAGGALGNMDRVTAWRFINPPLTFAKGMIVNLKGERFINEMVYGATLGVEMTENHDGEAWLILDKSMVKTALGEVSGKKALTFQKMLAQLNARFAAKKGKTLDDLAGKIGIDSAALKAQCETYNGYASGNSPDPFGKTPEDITPIQNGPYYGINIGLSAGMFPCPSLTLGGLKVNEQTGAVLNKSGKPVKGLYAAGRNAIGVASWNYVSGLSIADGIYAGRRAARAMAK